MLIFFTYHFMYGTGIRTCISNWIVGGGGAARETSLMLYNLRVQRSTGKLTNYNQNAHNFFKNITSEWQRVNNSQTPKEYSLSQLDVHKCNSKRIIQSTSYWSKHINHSIHNDIKINKDDIVVVIIKLHVSRIFFFYLFNCVLCAHLSTFKNTLKYELWIHEFS